MITHTEAFTLGLVQALTEYLPVSSSGHLVIAQNLFGLEEPELFFDIVLHLGTLGAIVWYYRADIGAAFRDTAAALRDAPNGGLNAALREREGFRLAVMALVGTIPTGLIGVLFRDRFEAMFGSTLMVGAMLLVTGSILLATRFAGDRRRGVILMTWRDAVLIGAIQGLAITPGISRSGATISLALVLGIEREAAARFSFLLSVPAIIGAMAISAGSVKPDLSFMAAALGFSTSLVIGYLCLALLVVVVKSGRLSWFAYYCLPVGAATIWFSL